MLRQVTEYQRSTRLPGQSAQAGHVGPECEIAEPGVPVGHLETVERVHVEVHCQQIAAAVGAVAGDGVEEVVGAEPLADEPAEGVREGNEDSINSAGFDLGFELGVES